MNQKPWGGRFRRIMKGISLLYIVVFLVTITTGCVSNIVEINLRSNGTAQLGFIVGSSKQTIALIQKEATTKHLVDDWPESLMEKAKKQSEQGAQGGSSQGKSQDLSKQLQNTKPPAPAPVPTANGTAKDQRVAASDSYNLLIANIEETVKKVREAATKEGFKCVDYESNDIKGFKAVKDFNTYDEIKKLGTATKESNDNSAIFFNKFASGITIKNEQGKMELNINIDLTTEMNSIKAQLAQLAKSANLKNEVLDGYRAEFRIISFKKPESQNATSVENDGKKLVWDLKKTSKIEMKLINDKVVLDSNKSANTETGSMMGVVFLVTILIVGVVAFTVIKKKKASKPFSGGVDSTEKIKADKWNL